MWTLDQVTADLSRERPLADEDDEGHEQKPETHYRGRLPCALSLDRYLEDLVCRMPGALVDAFDGFCIWRL